MDVEEEMCIPYRKSLPARLDEVSGEDAGTTLALAEEPLLTHSLLHQNFVVDLELKKEELYETRDGQSEI